MIYEMSVQEIQIALAHHRTVIISAQEIAIKNKQHSPKLMKISYLFFATWQPNYPQDSSVQ